MIKPTILVLLLSNLVLCANAAEQIELKSVSIMGKENLELRFSLTKEKFLSTPHWDGKGNLPLALDKAIEIARAEVARKNPAKEFSVDEIELIKKSDAEEFRWYYKIQFDGDIPKKDERVYVLLDGSIVEPDITKKK